MNEVPECFYRVSIKALVLNDTRDKFLICKKENDWWDLPGGGLDWGARPQEDLPREISEEMSILVTNVAENPSYFLSYQKMNGLWTVNILFETTLENLDFTPSDECIDIKFVNKDVLGALQVLPGITQLVDMFNPLDHQ